MGAFLDKPRTEKQVFDGELVLSTAGTSAPTFAPGSAGHTPPCSYLIKFGGATMQGWRKYQEDRMSFMQLVPGQVPLCNSAIKGAGSQVPSPPCVNMLLLSIFDGHGGADTSEYAAQHFHPFLRTRVEERMLHWREQTAASQLPPSLSGGRGGHKRRHSFSETVVSSAPGSRSSSFAATLPPHPIDSEFLAKVFLEFDATIPLPSAETRPRNQPQQTTGGMRRPQPQAPLGNNIPHLASGTTATTCVIDLANNHVVIAHIGDSRAVVFSGVKELGPTSEPVQLTPPSEDDAAAAFNSPDKFKMRRKKGSKRSGAGGPSVTSPSTRFLLQYHSRDHHPDDPLEQQRIQSGHFAHTFLNHQPPKSRICHALQRISLNVVRGFGDAWFKLEESLPQQDQMVCVVPDCWASKFPMALPAMVADEELLPAAPAAVDPEHRRPESPTSRSTCTTPVLAPVSATRVALPPAGETLFIVLASDGIWNSEFPPHAPGVSIQHGSETAIKKAPKPPKPAPVAVPVESAARPMLAHQPSIATMSDEARAARAAALPESDDEDEELTQVDRPVEHVNAMDESGDAPSIAAAAPTAAEEEEGSSSEEESDSSGWSSSSGEDDYADMQVNMAVAQFFYNHAQPIVDHQVAEMAKEAAHAAPSASSSALTAATAASPARTKSRPGVFGARQPSVPDVATEAASASAAAAAADVPYAVAPPCPSGSDYSSLVSQSLDLLMAQSPLSKQNLKSTDNMSAWLVSITPIGVNSQPNGVPVFNLTSCSDDPFESPPAQSPPPPQQLSSTAAISAAFLAPSPTRPILVNGTGALSPAVKSPITPSPSTPVTPRIGGFTPPLAQQRSAPVHTDRPLLGGDRSASMPSPARASSALNPMSPPLPMKVQRLVAAVPNTEWPSPASSSATRSHSRPIPVNVVRQLSDASNATTPLLDRMDEDPPSQPLPERQSSSARKRRRDDHPDDTGSSASDEKQQPSDLETSIAPQRVPSRAESVADLLFSGNTMTDSEPTEAVLEPTLAPTTDDVIAAPVKTPRKRTSRDRAQAQRANADADMAMADAVDAKAEVPATPEAVTVGRSRRSRTPTSIALAAAVPDSTAEPSPTARPSSRSGRAPRTATSPPVESRRTLRARTPSPSPKQAQSVSRGRRTSLPAVDAVEPPAKATGGRRATRLAPAPALTAVTVAPTVLLKSSQPIPGLAVIDAPPTPQPIIVLPAQRSPAARKRAKQH